MEFLYTYKRWLILSALVHVIILTFILFINKASFLRPVLMMSGDGMGSAINVDVVGLPNVLKKDIASLNEPAEQEDSAEMVLKTRERISENKRSLIQRLKSTLEDKSSYLKKVDVIKGLRKGQAGLGTGNGTGEGSGGNGNSDQLQASPYFHTIKELIRSYWQIPTWLKAEGLHAQITIKIGPDGQLTEIQMTQSSGNPDFDKLAYQAVRNSAPFTPPPLAVKDLVQNGVVLSFP